MTKAIAIAVLLVVTRASADPWTDGVPPDTQTAANALYAEGNQLFAQQAHGPALDKYRAAIAIWDHPMIRFNMAVTEIRLGRVLDAADDLDKALRFGRAPFTPELYSQALDYQALVKGRVGSITATCKSPEVHATLDGKPWLDCPASRTDRVLAGTHLVVGEGKGFLTSSRHVVVTGGATTIETVELVPLESVMRVEYPYPRWIPWTVAGGAAAIALGGIGVWLSGRNQLDQFQADVTTQCAHGCPSDSPQWRLLTDEQAGGKLKDRIGVGMMIGGGAATIAGVVMVILDRPRRVIPSFEAAPGGGMTATLAGRF